MKRKDSLMVAGPVWRMTGLKVYRNRETRQVAAQQGPVVSEALSQCVHCGNPTIALMTDEWQCLLCGWRGWTRRVS